MAIISNTNYTNTSSSPIIIGVDNGYGNMKTAHTVFPTGILHHTGEPVFKNDLLFYEGFDNFVWGGDIMTCLSMKASIIP